MNAITSADIIRSARDAMQPHDRQQADIERDFWAAADAFDRLAAEARQCLDAMKAIGA